MSAVERLDRSGPAATDGEIALINLESTRRGAWLRFAQNPRIAGVADSIVDLERLALQFLGDVDALDRLDALAAQFARVDGSFRAALIEATVATAAHRFEDARAHLARASMLGALSGQLEHQSLTIDQACGADLDAVLAARRRIAASGRLEDLVPLGAVLADLERFAEADAIYGQAFYSYQGTSPFPLAWVCFQLGMLWGELVPEADEGLAASWYLRAIDYVPGYVQARVHLAEIYTRQDRTDDAVALLAPVLASRNPEARWRLADVLLAQGRLEQAELQLDIARLGYDALLRKHLFAFADHGAEFYAGSGNDWQRARELVRVNVANRPTRRAIRQAHAIESRLTGAKP
jgi:tetratricopeptide (TPR) repeat protein